MRDPLDFEAAQVDDEEADSPFQPLDDTDPESGDDIYMRCDDA